MIRPRLAARRHAGGRIPAVRWRRGSAVRKARFMAPVLNPRDKKEAQILRAAEKLLASRGLHGTRMEDIARAARLPRSNLYYYFSSKRQIYRRIITQLRADWEQAFAHIGPGREPDEAIRDYIHAKMEYSRKHPVASKVFAKEVIRGSDMLTPEENEGIRALTAEKCAVLRKWMDEGKMDRMDPRHFLFLVWGATQYYADFEQQIRSILGARRLTKAHFKDGVDTILHIVFKGVGFKL